MRGNGLLLVLGLGIVGLLAVTLFSTAVNGGEAATPQAQPTIAAPASGGVQDVYVRALSTGAYDHPYLSVKANQPVRLHFSADPAAGCGHGFMMRDFGIRLVAQDGGEQVVEFTPGPGKHPYSCFMNMFRGVLEAR